MILKGKKNILDIVFWGVGVAALVTEAKHEIVD